MQVKCKFCNKMFKEIRENDWLSKIFLSIYLTKLTDSVQSFTKYFPLLHNCSVMVKSEESLFADVSDKETQGHIISDLSCFTHI